MKNKIGVPLFFRLVLFFVLVSIDQLTKHYAELHLKYGSEKAIIEPLIGLSYVENTGAAWGMLSGYRVILIGLPVLMSVFLSYYLWDTLRKKQFVLSYAITVLLAGAVGNLCDRIFRGGRVIDFLEFRFMEFPVFNFADICVTVGAAGMFLYLLFCFKEVK